MTKRLFNKEKVSTAKKSPELSSAVVRISHKIKSRSSNGDIVKIEGKYYRMRELG